MVRISQKTVKGHKYYYVEHTFKIEGKIKKKEQYLGKSIPKDIDNIKILFLNEIYKEKWYSKLDEIKRNFSKEFRNMPRLAKDKYIENFMVKFTYNSNKIEGGTLTLRETANLLEYGITPKNKSMSEIKETETHKKVFYEMLSHKGNLNLKTVLYWHRLLFQTSEPEIAGKIRKHQVGVAGSKSEFPFPAELDILLRELFKWYHKNKDKIHPVELASLIHLKFVSIHPFTDGNGRISRIIQNFILQKHRFPMLNISYVNRSRYYTALERSQVKGIERVFVQHIVKRYIKEHKNYLKPCQDLLTH